MGEEIAADWQRSIEMTADDGDDAVKERGPDGADETVTS